MMKKLVFLAVLMHENGTYDIKTSTSEINSCASETTVHRKLPDTLSDNFFTSRPVFPKAALQQPVQVKGRLHRRMKRRESSEIVRVGKCFICRILFLAAPPSQSNYQIVGCFLRDVAHSSALSPCSSV